MLRVRTFTLGLVVASVLAGAALAPAKPEDPRPAPASQPTDQAPEFALDDPTRPAVHVAAVRTDAGGSLADSALPFCSADRIEAGALTARAEGFNLRWHVHSGDGFPADVGTAPDGRSVSFHLTGLTPWADPYYPRTPLTFQLTASLFDRAGREVASDTVSVTQNDLGQLRQEYVDHNLLVPARMKRVPEVDAFRFIPRDGHWNDGDYDWALVSDWAVQANNLVQAASFREGLLAGGPVRVTSVFRNPTRHWRLYWNMGKRPTIGSRHMWGVAIDYGVDDFDHDGQRKEWADYGILRSVADGAGKVIPEGRTDHVHVQEPL